MAIYHLISDSEFEAEDLKDAFKKLAQHFAKLYNDPKGTDDLFLGGNIELRRRGNIVLPPGFSSDGIKKS